MRLALVIVVAACKAKDPQVAPSHSVAAAPVAQRSAVIPPPIPAPVLRATADTAFASAEKLGTLEAWDDAAAKLARARDACSTDCRELAYETLLAMKNAMKLDTALVRPDPLPVEPLPLPPRVEAFIDAADAYLATSPLDEESNGIAFVAANSYNQYGWLDEAQTRFTSIFQSRPQDAVAEYASNLMLDGLDRQTNYEELVTWAKTMWANQALMAAHPELQQTVRAILMQSLRH